jgi:hypothetical protein
MEATRFEHNPMPAQTRFAFLTATSAFAVFLHRRARHRAVRAEHAAIACKRFQRLAAALADIKELAGFGWHLLDGSMVASRAGECGLELHRWLAGTIFKERGGSSCPVRPALACLIPARSVKPR